MNSSANPCCASCDLTIDEDHLAICCEGFCGRWFHCSCVGISKEECDMFTALEDQAVWLCPIDKLEFNKWKIASKKSADCLNKTIREASGLTTGVDSILQQLVDIKSELRVITELNLLISKNNNCSHQNDKDSAKHKSKHKKQKSQGETSLRDNLKSATASRVVDRSSSSSFVVVDPISTSTSTPV